MAAHTTTQFASSRRFLAPALLLLLALLLRLPSIGQPLVGAFATRNIVHAMIARNWVEGRAPLWRPTLDVLIGDQRAWHLVELPVQAYLSGGLWDAFGGSLDVWGRVVSIAFSLLAVMALYALLNRLHGPAAATAGAALLAVAPVSVIYGQKFMLEPSIAALSILTLYTAERWLGSWQKRWLAALVFTLAILLLSKCYMAVILLPLLVRLVQTLREQQIAQSRAIDRPTNRRVALLATLAVAVAATPALLWCGWAFAASATSELGEPPVFFSLRRSSVAHAIPSPLLWDTSFYSQLLRDLATVVLTPVGLGLFLIGLAHRSARRHLPWLTASALLVLLLPRKFHEMNYYFLVVLPPLSAIAGLGWRLIREKLQPSRTAVACVAAALFVLALRYSASPAYIIPAEDRSVVAAAGAARPLIAADQPVVTMHGSTIDLLYYCNRPGWAVAPDAEDLEHRLADYYSQGARVLVVAGLSWQTRHTGCREMLASLEPVVSGDDYAIYQLPEAATLASGAGTVEADTAHASVVRVSRVESLLPDSGSLAPER
jgi:hypothetical protein